MIQWVPDADSVAQCTDEQPLEGWQKTGGEGPEAEVIIAEIEKRHLDG